MPLEFDIEGRVLVFRSSGETSPEEERSSLLAGLDAARHAFHGAGPVVDLLLDESTTSGRRQTQHLRERAALLGRYGDVLSGLGVIIATSDLQFGMARIFAVHADEHGLRIGVVRDEKSALNWLHQNSADSRDRGDADDQA